MSTRRTLLKALASLPFIGHVLATPSTSSVDKISEVVEKTYIGSVCNIPESLTSLDYCHLLPPAIKLAYTNFVSTAPELSRDLNNQYLSSAF